MINYSTRQIKRLLRVEFIRFCIVGGTGFVINFVILNFLHKFVGLDIFFAQLIGAEIALFSNFMLHHHWTYKYRKVEKSIKTLLIQFHATTWPAIVGSALMVAAAEKWLHLGNLVALLISSAISLLWNFMWSRYIIWKGVTNSEVESIVK